MPCTRKPEEMQPKPIPMAIPIPRHRAQHPMAHEMPHPASWQPAVKQMGWLCDCLQKMGPQHARWIPVPCQGPGNGATLLGRSRQPKGASCLVAGLGLSLLGLGDTLALAALGERLGLVALGERLWMGDWLLLATGLQAGRCIAKPYSDIDVPWNLTHQAMTRNGTGRFAGISLEQSICLWHSERGKAPPPPIAMAPSSHQVHGTR